MQKHNFRDMTFLGLALVTLAIYSKAANAGIIFYEGGGGSGVEVVNLRTVALADATNDIYGDTVTTNYEILFHSNSDLLYTEGTGQAKIRATEVATDLDVADPNTYGVIGDLTFGPTDPLLDMSKAIWNVDVETDSQVFVSGIDQDGVAFANTFNFLAESNGSNWVTAEAIHGQSIDSITISGQSIVGVSDLQQFRVGVTEVPVPGALGLFAMGLVGLVCVRRRPQMV